MWCAVCCALSYSHILSLLHAQTLSPSHTLTISLSLSLSDYPPLNPFFTSLWCKESEVDSVLVDYLMPFSSAEAYIEGEGEYDSEEENEETDEEEEGSEDDEDDDDEEGKFHFCIFSEVFFVFVCCIFFLFC